MEKQLWRVWSVSSLFTARIFQCTSRCFLLLFFFFQFFKILTFFFLMELYFGKGKYFCPGTFVGWQLQNKLFNKPSLLTGSSGQIFQIKLSYCSSAFFPLSESWTLFWSWMPDKQLCHEKYMFLMIFLCPHQSPTPSAKTQPGACIFTKSIRDLVSFVRHKLWSGCEGVQAVQRLR